MEHRNIEDIKQELFSHPDYVSHSIWTRELCVQEIENCIDSNFNIDDWDKKAEVAEMIFDDNIKIIQTNIDGGYIIGFEDLDILENINLDNYVFDNDEKEDEEIKDELKNKLV
jgi:hypothetical protein